ncbi:single-stranded DNA-binding protein [Caviibacter abscessus]|uniref:single-stranded DNA-binding protein n=1 Tax=Caviibacter abscessus TaxID=1766719 RepID=UPI00083273E7|nr:single-stranded DNA-binding protein [Caviibacter abscessus]
MNYVSLLGRLTKDVELKQTSTGKTYCRFTLAVKKEYASEGADFINCVAWDKKAEFLANYFTKGQRVLIQGRLNTGSYEVNGEKRFTTDVLIDKISFVESQQNAQSVSYGNKSTSMDIPQEDNMEDDSLDDDEFPF